MRGMEATVESSVSGLDEPQLPLSPAERETRIPSRERLRARVRSNAWNPFSLSSGRGLG